MCRDMGMTGPPAPFKAIPCPCCNAAMLLVQHIDMEGVPEIYVYYCSHCQYVEAIKEEREV